MKLILILLIGIAFVGSVNCQEINKQCSDYKYGKFTYPLLPEGSGYAIRENNLQIEYLRNDLKLLVWEVKWIDECHYNLTLIEEFDEEGHWTVGDFMEVEITDFKKNCYGFKSTLTVKSIKGNHIAFDMMCKEEEL